MAGRAVLLEFAFMWISVTVGASCKLQAAIARLPVGSRCVAPLAGGLQVHASQPEACPGMVEGMSVNAGACPALS